MAPQPVSTMKWNGNYVFGNNVLINLPEYGSQVAAVIAGWAIIEATLGRTFATLIGARQPVAMSMYSAARSFEIQRELFMVAVDAVMPKSYAELIGATLVVVNRSAIHRHRFAHWIWGASADPALVALFLVEPKNFWNVTAAQTRFWQKRGGLGVAYAFHPDMPQLPRNHIAVYRLTDLKEIVAELERAHSLVDRLRGLVASKTPMRRSIASWLRNQADILSALEKAKNGRKPRD